MQAELRFGQPPQILASLAPCSTPHAPLRQTGINTFPVLRAAIQRSLDRAAHPPTARRPSCPIWLAVTLSILLAGLGCRKDPVPSPPEVQPLLYIHPAEADNLARNIERELQARRERSCARPVLRGLSVAGKPDPLIRDLVEASGTLAPCARAATRHQSTLASWLLGPAGASTPLPRLAPQALHAAPPPAVRAALSDLRAHCSSLPGAIARVTRFRSVCNPYRPDGGPRPSLLPLVRLHLAAAAIAVSMAREHPDDALWLLLETLRLDQDLERGPTELAWPLALVAASRPVISVLGAWLCAGLPSRLRPTLARVLDALIATEPWSPAIFEESASAASGATMPPTTDGRGVTRVGWPPRPVFSPGSAFIARPVEWSRCAPSPPPHAPVLGAYGPWSPAPPPTPWQSFGSGGSGCRSSSPAPPQRVRSAPLRAGGSRDRPWPWWNRSWSCTPTQTCVAHWSAPSIWSRSVFRWPRWALRGRRGSRPRPRGRWPASTRCRGRMSRCASSLSRMDLSCSPRRSGSRQRASPGSGTDCVRVATAPTPRALPRSPEPPPPPRLERAARDAIGAPGARCLRTRGCGAREEAR